MEKKPNKLGLDSEYLALEMPSTVDDYLQWISYKERKIILNDNIDSLTINTIGHWILKWNEEDKNIEPSQRKTINIYITSNGGDVVAGLGVCDIIKASKTPVHTTAIGCAASMGIILLMSGHKRFAYPNTVLLIHDGSLAVQGSSRKAKNTMDFYDELDSRVKHFVLDNTKISEELYDSKADEEWYLFASPTGIELGIIDEIIK